MTISGFLKVAAKHYNREGLADIMAAEIILYAWRRFEEGYSPAGAFKSLRGELPSLSRGQGTRALKLILREWKTFQLERRGSQ